MTTPTPAQQHVHKLRRMRENCTGFAHLDEERAALDYALAALEAVEGAEDCMCSDCNGDGVWHLEPCGYCNGHGNFKMVPAPKSADAVEVKS